MRKVTLLHLSVRLSTWRLSLGGQEEGPVQWGSSWEILNKFEHVWVVSLYKNSGPYFCIMGNSQSISFWEILIKSYPKAPPPPLPRVDCVPLLKNTWSATVCLFLFINRTACCLLNPFDRHSVDVRFYSYIVVPDPSLVKQNQQKTTKQNIALIAGISFGILLLCTVIAILFKRLCFPKVNELWISQHRGTNVKVCQKYPALCVFKLLWKKKLWLWSEIRWMGSRPLKRFLDSMFSTIFTLADKLNICIAIQCYAVVLKG